MGQRHGGIIQIGMLQRVFKSVYVVAGKLRRDRQFRKMAERAFKPDAVVRHTVDINPVRGNDPYACITEGASADFERAGLLMVLLLHSVAAVARRTVSMHLYRIRHIALHLGMDAHARIKFRLQGEFERMIHHDRDQAEHDDGCRPGQREMLLLIKVDLSERHSGPVVYGVIKAGVDAGVDILQADIPGRISKKVFEFFCEPVPAVLDPVPGSLGHVLGLVLERIPQAFDLFDFFDPLPYVAPEAADMEVSLSQGGIHEKGPAEPGFEVRLERDPPFRVFAGDIHHPFGVKALAVKQPGQAALVHVIQGDFRPSGADGRHGLSLSVRGLPHRGIRGMLG